MNTEYRPRRAGWMRQRGFTLVEVLVALVIFGVIAASVLKTLQDSVRQQAALEERLTANWVAQQALAEIRLRTDWPPLGKKTEKVLLADREWQVTAEVKTTNEPKMRHIVVQVGRPEAEAPILTIDSWVAQSVGAGAGTGAATEGRG
ncbi:type II secretion system minor pseudopilin GspI [Microbulbifer hydrolyticus]|uniref:Type II secretion system protein I n=1 Tax=Microbulbifer hydrolyticus TaxID=48074 RepID=A0A6P1TBQ5_9GAMM|nr:type II secretion system minor pseudopilin GspI [Microbulbifer hydrolyticus]MBB5210452.1 general secretion pathway protein I [Microbulbifer hydrolyticus]QHQ39066.1 type II secretion system minor pseudopilin GspI [Microbulbifer hydrolyticus]